jgi:group I intron endonuclease
MDTTRIESICDKILDNPTERYCEIYKITNIKNNKIYVGQCVSHILNHKRYRPYGHKKRFNTHVSEAFSQKKNQSYYLNNAIKKHGVENFMVEILEYCELNHSDEREFYYITNLNSLFPNGYNLKNGGSVFIHTDESKKKYPTD